jgi:hypothetical protein
MWLFPVTCHGLKILVKMSSLNQREEVQEPSAAWDAFKTLPNKRVRMGCHIEGIRTSPGQKHWVDTVNHESQNRHISEPFG